MAMKQPIHNLRVKLTGEPVLRTDDIIVRGQDVKEGRSSALVPLHSFNEFQASRPRSRSAAERDAKAAGHVRSIVYTYAAMFVDPGLQLSSPDLFLFASNITYCLVGLQLLSLLFLIITLASVRNIPSIVAAVILVIVLANCVLGIRISHIFSVRRPVALVRRSISILGNGTTAIIALVCVIQATRNGLLSSEVQFGILLSPILCICLTGSTRSSIVWAIFSTCHSILYLYLWSKQLRFPAPNIILLPTFNFAIAILQTIIANLFSILLAICIDGFIRENTTLYMIQQGQNEKVLLHQRQFVAQTTHELRTPLMQILGMVELFFDTSLNDNQTDLLQCIRSSAETVLALVNDVLDFEKIATNNLKLELIRFDIRDLVHSVLQAVRMSPISHNRNDRLEVIGNFDSDVPNIVIGDPLRFRQILQNLVGNAAKFVRNDPSVPAIIYVHMRVLEKEVIVEKHNKVRIEVVVEDNGIGMDATVLDNLFSEFVQGQANTTRLYGGTGLGLAISRSLARQMQGEMSAKSSGPNQGSTFKFDVVFDEPSGPRPLMIDVTAPRISATRTSPVRGSALICTEVQPLVDMATILIARAGMQQLRTGSPISNVDNLLALDSTDTKLVIVDMARYRHAVPATIARINEHFCCPIIVLVDDTLNGNLPGHVSCLVKPIVSYQLETAITFALFAMQRDQQFITDVQSNDSIDMKHRSEGSDMQLHFAGSASENASSNASARHSQILSPRSARQAVHGRSLPMHALLVDDNIVNLKLIGRFLQTLGHTFNTANNGQEALALLETHNWLVSEVPNLQPFDVVLTDIMMPVLDGIGLSIAIRAREAADARPRLAIYALSAASTGSVTDDCLRAGVDRFLSKPFTREMLQNALNELSLVAQGNGLTIPRVYHRSG